MADHRDPPELRYTPENIIDSIQSTSVETSKADKKEETAIKTRSTYYTTDDVKAARSNIQKYDWAAEQRERAVSKAEEILDLYSGLDGLWHYVTSQAVPRSSSVHNDRTAGSPISGTEIYEIDSNFPWQVDPVNEPWKVIDPVSGHKFPTNDFQAYYESGLDAHHEFDPDLADDSLLVNELYPEKGKQWGVDDGYGWVDDDGHRRVFIAYYNHWAVWKGGEPAAGENCTGYAIEEMLETFRDAYLFSGAQKYARAGTVLLDRIADLYPKMDISDYPFADGYYHSDGSTERGKVYGSISEHRFAKNLLWAYDGVFPGQSGDETLVAFLAEKAKQYELCEKASIAQIRTNIEANIVREVLPAVKTAQIRGNFGMLQSALALSAVVQDDPDGYTKEALEFVLQAGDTVGRGDDSQEIHVTGGNVLAEIVDVFDRDGHAEESPHYNAIHYGGVREVAEILDGYDAYEGPDLFEHVKVREMHAAPLRMIMLNQYYPHIGDSSTPGEPGLGHLQFVDVDALMDAYERYEEPMYAQAAYLLNGNSTEGLRGAIFEPNPDQLAAKIDDVIEAEGPLDLPSISEAGFGLVTLRDGHPAKDQNNDGESPLGNNQRVLWLYHGRGRSYSGHNHADALNLGIFAHELDLAPDIGYPEQPGTWPKGLNWTKNTISHNTVMVDREQQRSYWHEPTDRGGIGEPRQFAATDRVQLMDIEAPGVYPQTEQYRRMTAMLRVDDDHSYGVDVFRVHGGDEHHFSFHAGEGDVTTEGLTLTPQDAGTYAGPDVPVPDYGEDTAYNSDVGDGFNYLYNVDRDDDPGDQFSVEWDLEDTYDVRKEAGLPPDIVNLRLTMLSAVDDVAIADADVQRDAVPDQFTYLLAHNNGEDCASAFTSVLEPYAGSRFIKEIERVPVTSENGTAIDVEAVKVTLENGRTDYVASALNPLEKYIVDDTFSAAGSLTVYSERDGQPDYAYLHDGHLLEHLGDKEEGPHIRLTQGRYEGTVASFTRELTSDNKIEIHVEAGPRDTHPLTDLEGAWIYVDTDDPRNGAYEITGVTTQNDSRATLNIGQKTTVQEFQNSHNPQDGFDYTISAGDRFTVPVDIVWENR